MGVTVSPCAKCGRATEWEARLGPSPACVTCWDAILDADAIDADNARYLGKKGGAQW